MNFTSEFDILGNTLFASLPGVESEKQYHFHVCALGMKKEVSQ